MSLIIKAGTPTINNNKEAIFPVRQARQPTKKEQDELIRMTQQEVGRVAMRAQMILLSARGFTVPAIADIQSTSDVTVYKWLDRFQKDGPAGLYDLPRSGRPPKVDEAVNEAIEEAMSEPPTEQDYNFTCWTVPLLTQHLQQTLEKTFCTETIRNALHSLDFRWRRPRWAVEREDPEAKALMAAICQAILSASADTLIFIEDETTLKLLPPLRQMWMRKGQQVRVPTPASNEDICLYGALELNSGDSFYAFHDQGRSEYTIRYLEQLQTQYPHQPILLIWDQARYHTSQAVEEWLAQQSPITVMLLPKYAAELNPVESIWRQLKKQVAANLTRSLAAIKKAVVRFFEEHQPIDLLRMAGLSLSS
jgi:transposase